jgi:hypothetical protein
MCFLLSSKAPLRLIGIQKVYHSLCGDPACVPIVLGQVSSIAGNVICIEHVQDDYKAEGAEKWVLELGLPTTAGFTDTSKRKREKAVKQALLEHIKRHHDKFLQQQQASAESAADPIPLWNLHDGWHPGFKLEEVPLPLSASLPSSPEELEVLQALPLCRILRPRL